MDILEILGKIAFDPKIFLFNLINFAIVAALLWKFFFTKMIKNIETRQEEIERGLQTAEMAETEIVMAKQKSEELIEEAKIEAGNIVKEGVVKAKDAVEKVKAEADEEVERLHEKARTQIENERSKMMQDFKEEASELVVLATHKLLAEKNSADNTDKEDAERVISGLNLK